MAKSSNSAISKVQIDHAALDRLFEPHNRSDLPGIAVGVALASTPLYRRGFGLASVELPVTLSPTMRMRIGSTTKHFTCLLIMLLAEEGRLSPDDTARRHLPELPGWADAVTLRQLMTHTGGIRCSLDLILQLGGLGRVTEPGAQLALLTKQSDVNFAPGASYSYCNGGYVLLSEIVARHYAKPLGDVLREVIFEPIGMRDSQLKPYDTDLLANNATLHVANPAGGFTRGVFGPPIGGEGGIVSTVDDMLLWLAHMSDPVVGAPATWETIRTPMTTHGYALGLFVQSYRGVRIVHHAGGVIGGASQMLKVVDHDLDIIIMTNRAGVDPSSLAKQVIDTCVPDLDPLLEQMAVTPVVGTFHSNASSRTLRLLNQDGLQAVDLYGAKVPTHPEANGVIAVDLTTTDLRLLPVLEGDTTVAIDTTEFGKIERLLRTEVPAGAKPAPPVGHYTCDEADAVGKVSLEEGVGRLHVRSVWGSIIYWLEPLGPDLWLVETRSPLLPFGGYLESASDGFRFSSGRNSRLPFSFQLQK